MEFDANSWLQGPAKANKTEWMIYYISRTHNPRPLQASKCRTQHHCLNGIIKVRSYTSAATGLIRVHDVEKHYKRFLRWHAIKSSAKYGRNRCVRFQSSFFSFSTKIAINRKSRQISIQTKQHNPDEVISQNKNIVIIAQQLEYLR